MSLSTSDVQQIEKQIRALALRAGCEEADLDDVVQEAFVRLLSRPSFMKLRPSDGRRGAAIKSATLRAMKVVNRQHVGETVARPQVRDETSDPAKLAEDQDEHEHMMAKLAPRDREVARMLEQGYTIQEIADKTGVNYGEVHQHMRLLAQRNKEGVRLGAPYRRRNVNYKM